MSPGWAHHSRPACCNSNIESFLTNHLSLFPKLYLALALVNARALGPITQLPKKSFIAIFLTAKGKAKAVYQRTANTQSPKKCQYSALRISIASLMFLSCPLFSFWEIKERYHEETGNDCTAWLKSEITQEKKKIPQNTLLLGNRSGLRSGCR